MTTTIDTETLPYVDRIRAAYAQLAAPGELVGLVDLRPMVGGHRELVDAALRHLHRTPGATLMPEANQKTLSQADRDAAVVVGDQARHAISIS